MGSVTCGTGIKGIRAWSISPKKPAYLNQPRSPSPQHGCERHACLPDGGAVLWPREEPAAVVDDDGEQHEQQKLRPAAGVEGEAEREQDEIPCPAVPARHHKIKNEQAGKKENKKADTAEDHRKRAPVE